MKMQSSHKGFTLIEVLASIVIGSLALALIAQILVLFMVSSQDTIIYGKANTTGLLMVETLETRIRNFQPTTLSLCDGETSCVILESHYQYVITEEGISIVYYETPTTLTIEFTNQEMVLTREIGTPFIFDTQGFQVADTSRILIVGIDDGIDDGDKVTLIFELELTSDLFEGEVFSFTASYSFTVDIT